MAYLDIHSISALKDMLGMSAIVFKAKEDSDFIEDASIMKGRRVRIVTHKDNKLLLGGYILIKETLKYTKEGVNEGVAYTEYMLCIPSEKNIPVVVY